MDITDIINVFVLVGISQEFQLQPPAYVVAVLNTITIIPCGPPISIPPATIKWSKDFRQLSDNHFTVDGTNLTISDTQLLTVEYIIALHPIHSPLSRLSVKEPMYLL